MNKPWSVTDCPTLEFTTSIDIKTGCVVDCVYCPQRTLQGSYKGKKFLDLTEFKQVIDKLPQEIRVTFAGFTEPFLNPRCADMILYAFEKGHEISVFTTGIGMTVRDWNRIKHIPWAGQPNGGFTLHVPDDDLRAKHPITDKYINLLETIYMTWRRGEIGRNFNVMSMGKPHHRVMHLWDNPTQSQMWSRSGNLFHEAILKPELMNRKDEWKSVYHGEKDMTCGCIEELYHNVMLPNGDVSLCCMDYGLKHILGNLFEQEYEDVVPKMNTCFDLCRFCENGKAPTQETQQ